MFEEKYFASARICHMTQIKRIRAFKWHKTRQEFLLCLLYWHIVFVGSCALKKTQKKLIQSNLFQIFVQILIHESAFPLCKM